MTKAYDELLKIITSTAIEVDLLKAQQKIQLQMLLDFISENHPEQLDKFVKYFEKEMNSATDAISDKNSLSQLQMQMMLEELLSGFPNISAATDDSQDEKKD